MSSKNNIQIQKGTFLVASPEIENGIFYRSVILICEHSNKGSFGLIINKEIDFELSENIIELDDLANPKVELMAGGPLQMNQMMILHTLDETESKEVCPDVYLGGNLDFLQDILSDPDGPSTKLVFGYSSWASGILEREFLNGQWFVTKANVKYVFNMPSEIIWEEILKKMGGKYASLSMIPEDLSLN